jgi:hypothetical protein
MARIVLGDVLAEHGVELRGRAREPGVWSWEFWQRPHRWRLGMPSGKGTDITLARSPKSPWPCRLPGPVTRYAHPGELVAKVGYFGVKSAKVCRAQMGDQTC